jgi:hypothetical protein
MDFNPLTWLWCTISSFRILCHNLFVYLKLVKIGTLLFWVVWRMKDVFPLWSSLSIVSVIGLVCIYLWLWGCFSKKNSLWQISHTKRLLNLGKVKTSDMVTHESWFLMLLYPLKLDQTFKVLWILLISMMLTLRFGIPNLASMVTSWTHGWFWFLVSQCKLLHLGYEPSLTHFHILNFSIFYV